jgi:hypothetical protein
LDKETEYIDPHLSIKEEYFDVDIIPESRLIIEIGKTYFRFALKHKKQFVCLEDYNYPENLACVSFLKELFNQHPFLSARFWKSIKIIIHSEKKTFVPVYIMVPETNQIWEALFGENEKDYIIQSAVLDNGTLIYQSKKEILDFLEGFYTNSLFEIVPAEVVLMPLKEDQIVYTDGIGFNFTFQGNSYYHTEWQKIVSLMPNKKFKLIGEITKYAKSYRKMEAANLDISLPSSLSNEATPLFRDLPQHRYFIIFSI